jgi:hypothetical protein
VSARARRLNGGVQRQQIGLKGDFVNTPNDARDLRAGLRDLTHGPAQLLEPAIRFVNPRMRILH